MNLDDLEAIGALMVRYRLAEVKVSYGGALTMKKTIHEVERPQPQRRAPDRPVNPMDEEGTYDDEVLHYSTRALHATVDDLIRQAPRPTEPEKQ
jgi:hypothetical protein